MTRPDKKWAFHQDEPAADILVAKVTLKGTGGGTEVIVFISPNDAGIEAVAARDEAFEKLPDQEQAIDPSKSDVQIASIKCPSMDLTWNAESQQYQIQQAYLNHEKYLYTIAVYCPKDDLEAYWDTLTSIRDSIELIPVTKSESEKANDRLKKLTAKCGSELRWAKSWSEASEIAKREDKSILVTVRSQPGFDISDALSTVALMDTDVIDMVNHHCIAFRFTKGMDAPFVDYEKYGIGPSSFGSTVLLVEPDGTVFGDTFTSEPITFYDFLVSHLAARLQFDDIPANLQAPLEKADWLANGGKLNEAIELLNDLDGLEAHLLRASIYRRMLDADAAIRELDLANDLHPDEQQAASILADKAYIQLRTDRITVEDALATFESITKDHAKHERLAEMMFLSGMCQLGAGDVERAKATWQKVIDEFGDENRWAWQSAAALTSTGVRMGIKPEFAWPPAEVISAFRSEVFEPLSIEHMDRIEREAISYLLDKQRGDGSWISPPDALRAKGYKTSPFSVAVTSICGKALLAYRGNPRMDDRIARAVEFLVESYEEKQNGPDSPVFYMDYSPWGDAYLLRFLSAYVDTHPDQKAHVQGMVERAIEDLSKTQKPGGGWSYYVTHNLSQANQPSNQSISFMTAAVTIALLETKNSGFEVTDEMLNKALDCLERMRNDNKTFTYFLWHDNEERGRLSGEEGAAGRGPICSLALLIGERGSVEEVQDCLDMFMKYRHLYARERGKSLMHAAPDGEGSHYLMFDYAWAAEAVAALPEEKQSSYRNRLMQLMITSRSNKGSFLDNPINGWHYGTGMALDAMNLIR